MTKFLITFSVLIAVSALSIHARTSGSPQNVHSGTPHTNHYTQQNQGEPLASPSPTHHHKRLHRTHHKRQPPAAASTSDYEYRPQARELPTPEAMRRYDHIHRHFERQAEHQKHHRDHYKRLPRRIELPDLRSMPRLWQHLQEPGDRMYGDEPYVPDEEYDDEEYPQRLDERWALLANWAEDEGFGKSSPEELAAISKDVAVNQEDEVLSPEEEPLSPEDEPLSPEDVPLSPEDVAVSPEDLGASHDSSHEPGVHIKGCPKCESSRNVEHISEEELTRLRIEFVKQQILEKLRLKERPNVSAVGLPKPIYEGTTIDGTDDSEKSKDLDDYYARTSKKFIFLQREKRECKRLGAHPSMCFSFKIDDADADSFDVNTAVLWLFKNKQSQKPRRNANTTTTARGGLLQQQTIVVSEVQQQLDSKYLPIVKTIAIQSVDVQDEWMKIDIEWPIKRWFGNRDLSHLIHISCQSCDIKSMDEMISVDKDYRPFIMVDTQNRRGSSRKRRGINCTEGLTECCREKLYISFDEIGWGDWIIQPRGYDAYFCRGSCGSVASVSQSASYHASIMQKVLSSRGRKLELIPCCTAKQYSSLQIVFMDTNNTATQKTFPNMVIESCGCR